ncbi:MAG: MFS transporter [Fuerstiella sp.]
MPAATRGSMPGSQPDSRTETAPGAEPASGTEPANGSASEPATREAEPVNAEPTDAEPTDVGHVAAATIHRTSHPVFVLSYVANLTLVTANAATFVFADWVAWLSQHGTTGVRYQEELPGRIIQYGILAAITVRIFLGQSIDRFGVRRVWLTMSLMALTGMSIFASLTSLSPLLTLGRILFATGLAGMFTCGTFHIQSCVAEHRRTEFIALLGSSGFLGMILGPQLADLLRWLADGDADVFFPRVFGMAALLLGCYTACVLLVTRGLPPPAPHEARPSLIRLTRRYWPGLVAGVSMAMGVVFTVPSLFLVRFNQHEGFGGIATYWTTYALTAFTFRIRTAALSRRVGRYNLILFGLISQGLGLWALIPVSAWWHLLLSAAFCGFGHALLFPSIVSLGAGSFPARYRGSGTNLTLGCLDLGAGLSAPLLGRVIDLPQFNGVGFRQMFFVAGLIPLVLAVIWLVVKRGVTDSEVHGSETAPDDAARQTR